MNLKQVIEDAGFNTQSYDGAGTRRKLKHPVLSYHVDRSQSEASVAMIISAVPTQDMREVATAFFEVKALVSKNENGSESEHVVLYFPQIKYTD